MTQWTVHEHIVADATRFALRRAHQRYLFMNSKHHKSDAFQVTIKPLSTFRCFTNTACLLIYFPLVVTTGRWIASWKASFLWCLQFMNKKRWWALLRAKRVCYYMFMNTSPCHWTYCVPLFYICGYCYVQTTPLL